MIDEILKIKKQINTIPENLKENISTPEEKIIVKYNIGRDSRVQFKNDPKIYYVKNVATDKKSLFVTLNGQQTYNKKIKNLIKIGNSDVSI